MLAAFPGPPPALPRTRGHPCADARLNPCFISVVHPRCEPVGVPRSRARRHDSFVRIPMPTSSPRALTLCTALLSMGLPIPTTAARCSRCRMLEHPVRRSSVDRDAVGVAVDRTLPARLVYNSAAISGTTTSGCARLRRARFVFSPRVTCGVTSRRAGQQALPFPRWKRRGRTRARAAEPRDRDERDHARALEPLQRPSRPISIRLDDAQPPVIQIVLPAPKDWRAHGRRARQVDARVVGTAWYSERHRNMYAECRPSCRSSSAPRAPEPRRDGRRPIKCP